MFEDVLEFRDSGFLVLRSRGFVGAYNDSLNSRVIVFRGMGVVETFSTNILKLALFASFALFRRQRESSSTKTCS